ncbi:MAG: cobalamin-dependent protein, partial [Thermoprotei archaeon]|nr:cobalamin-dependent protein [Thermoprotei archaeon]
MRVLLALPPDIHTLEIYRSLGLKAPPLGLAYIAAILERAGHKVRILDSPTLEVTTSDFIREVKSWGPDVVGLSVLTPTAPKAYRAIRLIKELYPHLPVVVGGPHPTFMYEEALKMGADVVVLGEGELTSLELMNTIEEHGLNVDALERVRGIAFLKEGRPVITPPRPLIRDLDSIPWPARHLLPMERYTLFNKPIKAAHIMAIYFGVESGSQRTLNRVGKGIRLEQAVRVFQWVKELKGVAVGSFILGFPWETLDEMRRT